MPLSIRTLILFTIYAICHLQFNYAAIDNDLSKNNNKIQQQPAITLTFYKALHAADNAKCQLQNKLHNFLEHLQRNLTTSHVFNANTTQHVAYKLHRIEELCVYFETAGEFVKQFAHKAEIFFEATKNESNALLQKLRQVPAAQRLLSMQLKQQLTNYFVEMEFLHILFSELIDEVLEYAIDVLHATQRTFQHYADIQKEVLQQWHFNATDECCNRYMNFLQHWSAQIYNCAGDSTLTTVYDVYAVTEVTIRHVLQQLEYRIERIFNCFRLQQFQMRCRFMLQPEQDFEKLRLKLDELQMYFDVKAKHGLVSVNRHRHQRRQTDKQYWKKHNILFLHDKCIPYGFPDTQMPYNLKICFLQLIELHQMAQH